jgi:NAD(P)-dependent dehydrogenase (short-subunit alcohol dehydrogenase family)
MTAAKVLVVGAGGVLGGALCTEFRAAGYRVLGLRRHASESEAAADVVPCDLSNPLATWRVIDGLVRQHGHFDVAICNAAHLDIAPFMELALEHFDSAWRACVGTAFACARALLPSMRGRGKGALIMSGATASLRGSARFSAFASAKFALRGLAQSLAREFQPEGVHVAHVVIDGVLRGSASEARFAKAAHACLEPREVARAYRQLAEQDANAWTHELDLRAQGEKF